MINNEAKTKAVNDYLSYLNNADLDGIVSLYAEDATVEDPVGSKIIKGRAAIREFYQQATSMKLQAELLGAVRCAGNEAAFPFQVTNFMGKEPVIIEIIDTFAFNDQGEVTSMRAFWGIENCRGDLSVFGV